MSTDAKIYAAAKQELTARRNRHSASEQARIRKFLAAHPEIAEIDAELSETASRIVGAILTKDSAERIDDIESENKALQKKRADILRSLGYDENYLDAKPYCPVCGDTGSKRCECLNSIYREMLVRSLSSLLDSGPNDFSEFSLDYYPVTSDSGIAPRVQMAGVLSICRLYAEKFSKDGKNLFFYGGTGLGKTFLSACIAKAVLEKGYSVIYDTASNIFASYEIARFGTGDDKEEAQENIERLKVCDLLIIDDLGTEFTTALTVSSLYDIINSRLMSGGSMIINSNLDEKAVASKYSPQISSRLSGGFESCRFVGNDVRTLKKARK